MAPRLRAKRRSGVAQVAPVMTQAFAIAREGQAQTETEALTLRSYAESVPEPGVGPLRFEDFPFQLEWYSEEVARAISLVIAKSAQVGASAYAWRVGVRQADQFGDRVVYVFPTGDHVKEFSDDRVDPAIEASPYLRSRIHGKVDTKTLKRIGNGSIYFRGSQSKAGAQSVAAQVIIMDEFDLLDKNNVAQYRRRISGAMQIGKVPKSIILGYPYMADGGIDQAFKSSDQRIWHVMCEECGEEQPITWSANVRWNVPGFHEGHSETEPYGDPERPLRVMSAGNDGFDDREEDLGEVWRCCRECGASMEDSHSGLKDGWIRKGRWIPQNPRSKTIGFHAWRGMVPRTDLHSLVKASRGTSAGELEAFHVLDLGEPYAEGQAQLTDEDLKRAQAHGLERAVEMYAGPNVVVAGVDVGDSKGIHMRIDEVLPRPEHMPFAPRRALWMGTVADFEAVAEKIELFRISMVAIDYMPERRMARTLQATFPGRVMLVEFSSDTSPPMEIVALPGSDPPVPVRVKVNRTDMLDSMMDAIRQERSWPLKRAPKDWADHLKRLRRVTEINSRGIPVRKYVTAGGGADDYGLAEGYTVIAAALVSALGVASEVIVAGRGHQIPNEAIGFTAVKLGSDHAGNYSPGMGG